VAKRRLFWQLFPSHVAITVLALVMVGWYVASRVDSFLLRHIGDDLTVRANLVATEVADKVGTWDEADLERLCRDLAKKSDSRITIILPSGHVAADSGRDPSSMENHAGRPEIRRVLGGEDAATATRYSGTLYEEMMYAAVPIRRDGRIIGVARVALSLASVTSSLRSIYRTAVAGGLLAAAVAAVLSLLVSRRISRPLVEMKRGAERFAAGDLTARLASPSTRELASLSETLNKMAADLDARIRAVTSQRSKEEAILSSMQEGVFAVDTDGRVITMNHAAAFMLGADAAAAAGRSVLEVVRSIELHDFMTRTLASAEPLEEEMSISGGGQRFLQLHGTALRDARGRQIGAVIVLNDVTRLRRLENLRREFVANVSHELKTPITSIKGFVETLQTGALGDRAEAERFLGIIARHTDRLNGIIDDLLLLSRVERDTERAAVDLKPAPVREALDAAVQMCTASAADKDIRITLDCPAELTAELNPPLLEQAVVNLLDNAIKYSARGKTVEVTAGQAGEEVIVSVRDQGCGIEREHLSRIFERFYRVDKARSRELGGTGLGLSIVKHIVQAHRGTVTVESEPGKGSTFTIHLPAKPAA